MSTDISKTDTCYKMKSSRPESHCLITCLAQSVQRLLRTSYAKPKVEELMERCVVSVFIFKYRVILLLLVTFG